MKIVFMGTPGFAAPSLERVIEEFQVEAVFTQPDRPKDRGKKVTMSEVKEVALKHNIPVYQPLKIKQDKEAIDAIRNINPDFIVVVAYGQILSKEILDIPRYGCINLHASLLPKYRGSAPINWAIIKGEKKFGNTTMLMDVGMDTGDMLLKNEVEITENMTFGELHDILMNEGKELLVSTLKLMAEGKITPEKQNDDETCYAPPLRKETGKINWKSSAKEINNLIRGLSPKPTAYTTYKADSMKIYKAEVLAEESNVEPGTIIDVSKTGIKVSTTAGTLLIKELQFPGGKRLKVEDYIRGNSIDKGIVLD